MTIESATEICFIADAMFGKLALYLRLLGFDTELAGKTIDIDDKNIITIMQNSKQVLITRDQALYNHIMRSSWGNNRTTLMESRQIEEQLVQLFHVFHISAKIIDIDHPENLPSRCAECNYPLELVPKNEIQDQVPPDTAQHTTQFWRCSNPKCQKVFWIGSHWRNIIQILRKVRNRLEITS